MFPLGWFCTASFPAHVRALLARLSNYFPSISPLCKLFLMLNTLLPGHIGPTARTLFQRTTKSPKVFDVRDRMGRLERHTLWPPKQINAIFLLDGHLKVCEVDPKFLLGNNACMWASDTVRYCETICTKAGIKNVGTHLLHAFHGVALLDVCRSGVTLLIAIIEYF